MGRCIRAAGSPKDAGHVGAEEAVEVGGHAGQGEAAAPAAVDSGAYRVEVDESGLEGGAGYVFEGLVHAAVEFDFVVEGAKDVGKGALKSTVSA